MEGNVTRRGSYDHITREAVENVIANELTGTIQQIPPIFSAIRKNGKRLYAEAREGKSAEDMDIEPREVEVFSFQLLNFDLPKFDIDIMCGGGTYVRSLVRDIGYKVGSVATTTYLERTKQGPFQLQDTLAKEAWNADNIYAAIETFNTAREKE
jgi:tRNA pseudouridine55 synthase